MKDCGCDGLNYYGMPYVGFGLKIDQYETNHVYLMKPSMYMTLPRVDPSLRVSRCSLGLWNLGALD